MQTLVTANASALPENGIPDEIVYIPEGVHQITPSVNGKPKTITVTLDPKRGSTIAAAFQKSLELRLADNVRPIIDFDHKSSGPAAGIPKSFRYEAGKGIMLAVDWTRAGREAIEGRDFSYSSPTFLLDDDGSPFGLPERGPIAALVNHPAFRGIQRIAAADETNPINPEKQNTMKLIAAKFNLDDADADFEKKVLSKVVAMEGDVNKLPGLESEKTTLQEKVDDLQKQLDTLKAEADAAAGDKADKAVAAACEAGRIAPKDEDTKKLWKDRVMAADWAVDALNALPVLHPTLGKQVVVRAGDNSNRGGSDFEAKAKALVSAGEASDIDTAFGILAERDPASYGEYLGTLS